MENRYACSCFFTFLCIGVKERKISRNGGSNALDKLNMNQKFMLLIIKYDRKMRALGFRVQICVCC